MISEKDDTPKRTTHRALRTNAREYPKPGLLVQSLPEITYPSYGGAQIFDAVGLATEFVDRYFTGTRSAIEGVGLREIAEETVRRHRLAYGDSSVYRDALDVGGELAYRIRGEDHVWTPDTIALFQHAVRGGDYARFKEFSRQVDQQTDRLLNLRGLFEFRFAARPVPLAEVEPASEIVKRFVTGAMSFGALSWEAHVNLAIAMNRLGAKSNTGEGGEDAERYVPLANGDAMRSAVKQVAEKNINPEAQISVKRVSEIGVGTIPLLWARRCEQRILGPKVCFATALGLASAVK